MRRKYEHVLTKRYHLDTPGRGRWRSALGALVFTGCLASSAWAQAVGDLDEFFRSVTDGRIEIVREGLVQHPDWANAELFMGIRPLYRASVLGREEVLALLLASGAEVNAVTDRGTHPLHASAQHGYPLITERLLAAGADVNVATSSGQTPLHFAVRYGHDDVAQLLVAKGASINPVDYMGRTPLHYAAGLGQLECVQFLCDNGAQLDLVDSEGYTPLGLCLAWKRNEFQQVGQYLAGKGARDVRPPSAQEPQEPQESPATPAPDGEPIGAPKK